MKSATSGPYNPSVSSAALRDATVEDARAIEAVHFASREAAYREHVQQWPPDGLNVDERVTRWEHWLATPEIHCIVAEVEGRIAGFGTVRGTKDPDGDPQRTAEMPTLYVHPDSWRTGLGAALCRAVLDRAEREGFRELTLWVLDINERARAFYATFGFEPDGTRKVDEGTSDRLMASRYRIELDRTRSA